MTCGEIAVRFQCNQSTARNWAAANGVAYTGEGKRKIFVWSEADVERFRKRERPGRRSKDFIKDRQTPAIKNTEKDYVEKTTFYIEARIGKGFRVDYAGKLKWTISPA
jgi:hypothetical protein